MEMSSVKINVFETFRFLHSYSNEHSRTLGSPGNSLSTMVATWNWSSLTSSAITWAAAPLCSFLLSWLLILTMSASLCVRSSWAATRSALVFSWKP